MALQRGDNDNRKKWGGKRPDRSPKYSVRDLQNDLQAIGTYSGRVDGDFGKNTERALKIGQWCLKNSTQILNNGNRLSYTPNNKISINGKLSATIQSMVHHWSQIGFRVTGDLVRMPAEGLRHIQLGSVFNKIGAPQVSQTEFLVSQSAAGMV